MRLCKLLHSALEPDALELLVTLGLSLDAEAEHARA